MRSVAKWLWDWWGILALLGLGLGLQGGIIPMGSFWYFFGPLLIVSLLTSPGAVAFAREWRKLREEQKRPLLLLTVTRIHERSTSRTQVADLPENEQESPGDEPHCGASLGGYECLRRPHVTGDHIAHGETEVVARWPSVGAS